MKRLLLLLIATLATGTLAAPPYAGMPQTRGRGTAGAGTGSGGSSGPSAGQTTAAMSLFLDPTGNDSNACTASGTSACLTWDGVMSKVPKGLCHTVTITMAAGSYTGGAVQGFYPCTANPTNGAYIFVVGDLTTNFTPATGSATGTATAGSAGSGTTFGTLTDSGATWTTDDLKDSVLEITGGTGSGQTRVIRSNTATVITVDGNWGTAPASGSTYAIRTTGSNFTTAVNRPALPGVAAASPAAMRIEGNHSNRTVSGTTTAPGAAFITFKRIGFVPGTATNAGVFVSDSYVAFTESRIIGNTSGVGITTLQNASVTIDKSVVKSGTGAAISTCFTNAFNNYLAVQFSTVETNATGTSAVVLCTSGSWLSNSINMTANGGSCVNAGAAGDSFSANFTSTKCTCSTGTVYGFYSRGVPGLGYVGNIGLAGVTIDGCAAGAVVADGTGANVTLTSTNNVFTGTGSAIGINAIQGGRVYISANPTITSYTTDISVDGVTSTYAAFDALSPVLIATDYGSVVSK